MIDAGEKTENNRWFYIFIGPCPRGYFAAIPDLGPKPLTVVYGLCNTVFLNAVKYSIVT